MQNPKVHVTANKNVFSMLNKSNVGDEIEKLAERTVNAPREGYGSVLPSHSRGNERRHWATENRTFYGTGRSNTSETLLRQAARMRMAGTMTRPLDQQSTKILSNLTGENLRRESDPQERVDVQRQWLAQTDAAIKVVNEEKNRINQIKDYDNETSLPIGTGIKNNLTMPNPERVYVPRRGQDVTKVPNQIITRK